MIGESVCRRCGAALFYDDVALYRKLVLRSATSFLCLDCLAADLNTTRDKLEALIDYYRKSGQCTLFR